MNALQAFIQSKPGSFLEVTDMPALIALDRLCPVLVRCGCCRFTCAAQDVAHLLKCIAAGGDYVRDVSFPVGSQDRAALLEGHLPDRRRTSYVEGRDWICTGNFDGSTCGTDADSGL